MSRIVALLALAISVAGELRAQDLTARTNLNLRAGPSTQNRVRRVLPSKSRLRVIEPDTLDGYIRVWDPRGNEGWVATAFVDKASTTSAMAAAAPACPVQGNAVGQRDQATNRKKNRTSAPKQLQHPAVADFVAPGNDATRWSEKTGVQIVAYVDTVYSGGAETCNCGSNDASVWDTHIEISRDPQHAARTDRMVVEVTPRIRVHHPDWTTASLAPQLQGHWVRFSGWLLYDWRHANESQNTHPNDPKQHNWRATAWEVHPVTAIEVCANDHCAP